MALIRFFSSISVPSRSKQTPCHFSGFLNPILPKRGQKTPRCWKKPKREEKNPSPSRSSPDRNVVPRVASASFPGRCVRRIAVVLRKVERGVSSSDGYECLIWSLRWRGTGLPVSLITIQALQEAAPSAETVRQSTRLVLVFDPLADGEMLGRNSSPGAASEVDIVEVLEPTVDSDPIPTEIRLCFAAGAFASLDAVDLHEVFKLRASAMRSVPVVLRGAFRSAIRVSIKNSERSCAQRSPS